MGGRALPILFEKSCVPGINLASVSGANRSKKSDNLAFVQGFGARCSPNWAFLHFFVRLSCEQSLRQLTMQN
jgi:hypothetical protein